MAQKYPSQKSNSPIFSTFSQSISYNMEAARLIHELAMHEDIWVIIDNLAMIIESLEFQSIPHIFYGIFQDAIKGNPQSEKIFLCLLCETQLKRLIPDHRYSLIWENVLANDYLDLWNYYNKIQDLFPNSAHILASVILFLMDVSRQFASTLFIHHPICNVMQVLDGFIQICQKNGIGEISNLKLTVDDFARVLLQRNENELVERFRKKLERILLEKGFEKSHDGIFYIDVQKLVTSKPQKNDTNEDMAGGGDYHFEVITDAIVEEAREKIKQFLLGEKLTLSRRSDRKWLQFLIYDRNPMVVESVLKNDHIYEREVALLTNKRSTPASILEKIYDNERWRNVYNIRVGIAKNPNAPYEIVYKIIPDLIQNDILEIMEFPELDIKVRRRAEAELKKKIRGLSVGGRIALARSTKIRKILDILIGDLNGNVVKAALHNPKIDVSSVLLLAQRDHTSPMALWAISQNVSWVQNVSIKIALLNNPNTPDYVKEEVRKVKAKGQPVVPIKEVEKPALKVYDLDADDYNSLETA